MAFWSRKKEQPQPAQDPKVEPTTSSIGAIRFEDAEPTFAGSGTSQMPPPSPSAGTMPNPMSGTVQRNPMAPNPAQSNPAPRMAPPRPTQNPPPREVFFGENQELGPKPAQPASYHTGQPQNPRPQSGSAMPFPGANAGNGFGQRNNSGTPNPQNSSVSPGTMPPPSRPRSPGMPQGVALNPAASPQERGIPVPPQSNEPSLNAAPQPQVRFENPGPSEEKKQRVRDRRMLKYRFVGAAMILVAVGVVVPFVVDSVPPAPTMTIPLTIPSENGKDVALISVPGSQGGQAHVVEEPPKTVPASAGTSQKEDAMPAGRSPETEDVQKNKNEQTAPNASPDAKKAEEDKLAEAKKAEEAKIAAAKKADAEKKAAEEKKIADAKAAAEAKKAEEARKAMESAAPQKGQFFVQVVATKDPARITSLAKNAREQGLPFYTEQVKSPNGIITRFRLGPFKTKNQAESARAQMALLGIKTSNVQQVK